MGHFTEEMEIGAALAEAHWERKERFDRHKELYSDYPDRILIEEVIRCGKRINRVVPNNQFPAFDVAIELYRDGNPKTPSPKQRQALINVLARYRS